MENLSEEELVQQALEERPRTGPTEKMTSALPIRKAPGRTIGHQRPVGQDLPRGAAGLGAGRVYCSCPDFRKNTLGTCKHILHVLDKVDAAVPRPRSRQTPYAHREPVRAHALRRRAGAADAAARPTWTPQRPKSSAPSADRPITDVRGSPVACIAQLERSGCEVTVYPDAEEYIQQQLVPAAHAADGRRNPQGPGRPSALRKTLLKVELLPYQLDGIAFAVGAGRAILADDMGLGKTIQGIGVAELLAPRGRHRPACWSSAPPRSSPSGAAEIERFTERSMPAGPRQRCRDGPAVPDDDSFFTICNYEQVLRDIAAIEAARWDLIILDEGQRIKNWEGEDQPRHQGAAVAVRPGAVAARRWRTGSTSSTRSWSSSTIAGWGPPSGFSTRHRVVDENGKVLGYKNLDELRERLKPILLRRTREQVLSRSAAAHDRDRAHPADRRADGPARRPQEDRRRSIITQALTSPKWTCCGCKRRCSMCRMAANSTFLVDKTAARLFQQARRARRSCWSDLAAEADRKIVLFSEWTTMLDLIEPLLAAARAGLRPAGRLGAAEAAAGAGAPLPERP